MKKKSVLYGIVCLAGIVLVLVGGAILDGRVSDVINGSRVGIGSALTAMGASKWKYYRMEEKDPSRWKQQEIDAKDERNVAIRNRAKAVAGEVLQWLVIVAAWIAIFMKAPLWVPLAATGLFLFKSILEMCLMARYQKQM